ncbi:hypothetical protein SAMN04487958_10312 [Vreelandella subterranea]|uniref:2TM domain-containing protein n=1 Tax=Vreelandella subterranea TaxID=416874 RepID=A0A1H9S1L0_9GAMM|nr:hypothetical protein SAMN04487958_10312 [Halomonas subterranea]
MNTTQKIARNAAIFATIITALMLYFVPDMVWWGYIVTWLFFAVMWHSSGIKRASRENLANLRDR